MRRADKKSGRRLRPQDRRRQESAGKAGRARHQGQGDRPALRPAAAADRQEAGRGGGLPQMGRRGAGHGRRRHQRRAGQQPAPIQPGLRPRARSDLPGSEEAAWLRANAREKQSLKAAQAGQRHLAGKGSMKLSAGFLFLLLGIAPPAVAQVSCVNTGAAEASSWTLWECVLEAPDGVAFGGRETYLTRLRGGIHGARGSEKRRLRGLGRRRRREAAFRHPPAFPLGGGERSHRLDLRHHLRDPGDLRFFGGQRAGGGAALCGR